MECTDENQCLCAPVEESTKSERLRRYMPGLPPEKVWLTDPLEIRGQLPEIGEHVIMTHLYDTRAPGDYGARNVYRGAQRAWDGGGLHGFGAVPCSSEGGDLWLRLRCVSYDR